MTAVRSSDELSSVRRALHALELLATAQGGRGVSDLARELGVHKSSVSRLLGTLQAAGFVDLNSISGRFELGAGVLRLAAIAGDRLELPRVGLPFLRALAERSGESANLSVRRGLFRVAVQEVESANRVRMVAGIGHPYPLHRGAPSKVLLASLPEDEFEKVLHALPPDESKPRALAELRVRIARVKENGYATSIAENIVGAASVAVPIRGADSTVIAALGVAGVTPRWSERQMRALLPSLLATAEDIERLIGTAASPRQRIDGARA